MISKLKVCVIGGGIFGLTAAIYLSRFSSEIKIFDKSNTILNGATQFNHNRHHFGYHYPRSLDTAFSALKQKKILIDFIEIRLIILLKIFMQFQK